MSKNSSTLPEEPLECEGESLAVNYDDLEHRSKPWPTTRSDLKYGRHRSCIQLNTKHLERKYQIMISPRTITINVARSDGTGTDIPELLSTPLLKVPDTYCFDCYRMTPQCYAAGCTLDSLVYACHVSPTFHAIQAHDVCALCVWRTCPPLGHTATYACI